VLIINEMLKNIHNLAFINTWEYASKFKRLLNKYYYLDFGSNRFGYSSCSYFV